MHVLCIDPGIVSIGIVQVVVNDDFTLKEIVSCDAINITKLTNGHVHDLISALLTQEKHIFDAVDAIVLERQPPMSAGMPLEIILRERYGDKLTFISPSTLHKAFGLQGYEYDGRKQRCVEIVTEQLRRWALDGVLNAIEASTRIQSMHRKHDVCDAILILIYWLKHKHKEYVKNRPCATSFSTFIEQFRHSK